MVDLANGKQTRYHDKICNLLTTIGLKINIEKTQVLLRVPTQTDPNAKIDRNPRQNQYTSSKRN